MYIPGRSYALKCSGGYANVRPPPSLSPMLGASPMGDFSRGYGIIIITSFLNAIIHIYNDIIIANCNVTVMHVVSVTIIILL